jgi:hypothetical protein
MTVESSSFSNNDDSELADPDQSFRPIASPRIPSRWWAFPVPARPPGTVLIQLCCVRNAAVGQRARDVLLHILRVGGNHPLLRD